MAVLWRQKEILVEFWSFQGFGPHVGTAHTWDNEKSPLSRDDAVMQNRSKRSNYLLWVDTAIDCNNNDDDEQQSLGRMLRQRRRDI
eukprot:scaffold2469_cov149-Skeletonema_menzelii.AAC.12